MTIAGVPCSVRAASALATRSAPTSRGLSVRILTPVLTPGPTTSGVQPNWARHSSVKVGIMGGTEEASTPPVNLYGGVVELWRDWRSKVLRRTAYSSGVPSTRVEMRHDARRLS